MADRFKTALRALRTDQRRVVLAAALMLATLLLPWYEKTTYAATSKLVATTQLKPALFVPSLVEASIMLVSVAVLALMLARGSEARFFLPIPDRVLVMAAGGWTCLLVFYRFVDQPNSENNARIVSDYDLSWGIFFGLIAAALLFASGWFLGEKPGVDPEHLPEPPQAGAH